jgi:hypothetical protein
MRYRVVPVVFLIACSGDLPSLQAIPPDLGKDNQALPDMSEVSRVDLQVTTLQLSNHGNPFDVQADEGYVYWTDNSDVGGVYAQEVSAPTNIIIASNQPSPTRLTYYSNIVFWVNQGDSSIWTGGVGTTPTKVASNQHGLMGVAASGSYLFWTADSSVWRSNWDGTGVQALATNVQPRDIYYAERWVFWANGNPGSYSLMRVSDAGLSMEQIIGQLTQVQAFRVDNSKVYWSDISQFAVGKVASISQEGGDVTVLAGNQNSPTSIATDAEYVYWGDAQEPKIQRVRKTGGSPETVIKFPVERAYTPQRLAVNSRYIYWTDMTGSLMRCTKPQ